MNEQFEQQLFDVYKDITFNSAKDSNVKRENANINGDTAMGTMLKYGSEGAKIFNAACMLDPAVAEAHTSGLIHIHDFDFYSLTTTCTQIDLSELFKNGFSTGHGFLREPNSINTAAALACIAIQSNQNDQHGGQSVPNFDYALAPYVAKTFRKQYVDEVVKLTKYQLLSSFNDTDVEALGNMFHREITEGIAEATMSNIADIERTFVRWYLSRFNLINIDRIVKVARQNAVQGTERATYQAMEAVVHNLNTMHSRAGAQIPFSSLNYGTDTTAEGRLVVKSLLHATEAGLGNGETPIFPIQIFKVKEGVNFNQTDPNYDLFKLAIKVSAKRLFPNFSFIDAPFNLRYYTPGKPETEVAYMGCRTRIMSNAYDADRQITYGRGNLSFTSINLPRLAIESNGSLSTFYNKLDETMDLVIKQLKDRFKVQGSKRVYNYPFLMGQGVWLDSDKLDPNDEVGEVLKHGSLTVGFIGLAECLKALTGKHHGESLLSQRIGIAIITRMRERMDTESRETGMNFTVIATPAEGLSGRFVKIDRARYGAIEGVTDRDYYTNSFHVPVYYSISAFRKIQIEAPYHALTNGGHITYVELDGDPSQNLEAFEKVIRCMKDRGVGYGSINHPVDRDPVCGYTSIIGDVCPRCGRREGEGVSTARLRSLGANMQYNGSSGKDAVGIDVGFERIRRITGYLVGTLERFNDAKRAEVLDRVKHT